MRSVVWSVACTRQMVFYYYMYHRESNGSDKHVVCLSGLVFLDVSLSLAPRLSQLETTPSKSLDRGSYFQG